MNDLEKQSFNNMKEQIEVRDDIIDKLFLRLDKSEENNEKLSKILFDFDYSIFQHLEFFLMVPYLFFYSWLLLE